MRKNAKTGLSTEIKVGGNRTTYKPVEMTDASVYDLARHWYTIEEISDRFNVSVNTVLGKHGVAFREGKADGMKKPRMLLDNILKGFAQLSPTDLARPDVPVHNLLKAIELHAKKYEGMGSKQTIITQTEEKPSVSDIRFVPLEKDGE